VATVTYDHVWKRYGPNAVVQDLTLDVRDGEYVVLVGPSGSGKSTALRMLAGLEEVSAGRILIGEREVNDLPPRERDVAMVFQSYALYPHMNVFDNLAYALKLRHQSRANIERRVLEVARMLAIDSLLERKPKQLSGGQRQRVALGRAVVREPKVFLMDEPLSNLDAQLRTQTRTELIKLHRRLGTTTIYVTHDQVGAMTMGDRIAVLDHGCLQQFDTPSILYQRPANVFVAAFIGSPAMNFFTMRVESREGRMLLRGDHLTLPAPEQYAPALQRFGGLSVIAGVRPEHVAVRGSAGGTADTAIAATVDLVETLGAEQTLYLDLGAGETLVARMPADPALTAGRQIEVVIPLERLYLFDPANGNAIDRDL
jgi:multiple sugar transport system ATP-binding protein